MSAAATVMSGQAAPGPLERAEALDLTGRLVDKSLIRVTRRSGVARYYMLAVIREFAADRLMAAGMAEEAARRHAHFYITLAEEAEGQLRGVNQAQWLERLDGELDNLRSAMAWSLRTRSVREALHLAGGLWREGQYVETHTRAVPEESWKLLEWLVPRSDIRAVIIERDDELPPFGHLLAEVRRAEGLLHA